MKLPSMMISFQRLFCLGLLVVLIPGASLRAAEPVSFERLSQEYQATTHKLLQQYCIKCHSTEQMDGELDLERFVDLKSVRGDTTVWLKVAEMLDNGEMPPKEARPLSKEQRAELRGWISRYLDAEALASAGDPGPVVLRRLSNAEYTYTIQDLTGVPSLFPAKEFPADSAAGEGFTNTGNALVMSPALLTKYFDAAKGVARHAVLLPDGFRFSGTSTRSDWTNETLAEIRRFYSEFTANDGATQVNLQGVIFDTNGGGRLPIEQYLKVTLVEREALLAGEKTVEQVAREHDVSPKYLGILWRTLTDKRPSPILTPFRNRWKTAGGDDVTALQRDLAVWQQALFRFNSVGHIGKVGGPTGWQEPVTPLAATQELRLKLAPEPGQTEVVLSLVTGDAGDGHEHDFAVWEHPRLVAPGRPDLPLRDVRRFVTAMTARRARLFSQSAQALSAAAEASRDTLSNTQPLDVKALAQKYQIDPESLASWLEYLGIGNAVAPKLDLFTNKIPQAGSYEFIRGWGAPETPNIVANSSDMAVRIPGHMRPHGVCVHPSPTLFVAASWLSPVATPLRIQGRVQHAHPECGNGVTWTVEWRRGATRQRLAAGIAHGSNPITFGPLDPIQVRPGDLVSLLIGPRDGNHSCDLTDIELDLTSTEAVNGEARSWNLARDISPDILAANPHADSYGHANVWHFHTEPIKGREKGPVIPAGSVLARWQSTTKPEEQQALATAVQKLLLDGPAAGTDPQHPDAQLHRQLVSLGGPLLAAEWNNLSRSTEQTGQQPASSSNQASVYGLDPQLFGKHPQGGEIDPLSLCVQAPMILKIRLPLDLIDGAEFVATGHLHAPTGQEGSIQLSATTAPVDAQTGLVPAGTKQTTASGVWTSDNRRLTYAAPILTMEGSAARKRIEADFAEFRTVFPIALCYPKIVPVDEVVTLTLFYREDDALQRLMLTDLQMARLNQLWSELRFVSHDALTLVDAFEQLLEYASQDADPKVFEPLRKPIMDRAEAFRKTLVSAEPKHLDSLLAFAGSAYRRPLTSAESAELRQLYHELRQAELPHDEAFRLTLARVLVAPAFLYRLEQPPAGTAPGPVSDYELATRLSYCLWASTPDAELLQVASEGKLRDPAVLQAQTRRMLADPRTRRLATEFACQWLHIYQFDELDEKSERHFPTFLELRDDMYEESILFFNDLFQNDGSIMEILESDRTFLNEALAKHYDIPDVIGPQWRRVEGMRKFGRGGILGQATTLSKQSGASRTSPILRGNWISEVLLGEKLPKPPKDVPLLPEDEASAELSMRQLVEKHTSDPRCSNCHVRIDPFGFSLEAYDAIGRRRDKDLGDRPLDVTAKLQDGTEFAGIDGLRNYLAETRRDAFVRQFCRKLLGYALARGVQLSDEPLLQELHEKLRKNEYRISVALETIIASPQFREIRGRDLAVTAQE